MPGWRVEHLVGDAGEFHDRVPPEGERLATFFRCDRPMLVVGSAQQMATIDTAAAERHGVTIVRRRSGGGGVLLWPDEFVWLDLVIPAGDDLWDADVGRSMWWVGELWCAALAHVQPSAAVHRGPLIRTPWSAGVCFAGVGPGEVIDGAAKLVGIAQRRTRTTSRFQTMVHLRWRPDVVADLLAAPTAPLEFADLVAICPSPAAVITAHLAVALDLT